MAVRTSYVGTEAVGDVLTKANFDKLPGGWIGYVEVTANQTGITTAAVALTGVTVTVTAGTTRRLKITGHAEFAETVATVAVVDLLIYEDGVQVGRGKLGDPAAQSESADAVAIRTPSAGAHTYALFAITNAGTVSMVAAATAPAFILVEDIGPAS